MRSQLGQPLDGVRDMLENLETGDQVELPVERELRDASLSEAIGEPGRPLACLADHPVRQIEAVSIPPSLQELVHYHAVSAADIHMTLSIAGKVRLD